MTKKMVLAVSVLLLSLLFIACESPCAHGGDMIEKVVAEADCETKGVVEHICANCGKVVKKVTIDYGGHIWKTTVTAKVTCETDGEQETKCTRCGAYKDPDNPKEVITALGHDWDNPDYANREATCTLDGGMFRTCKRCGEEQYKDGTTIAPKLGHEFSVPAGEKAATCTEAGYTRYSCSRECGATDDVVIEALGHQYGDYTVTEESTCIKPGTKTRTCSVCNYVDVTTVEVADHAYGEDFTTIVEAKCNEDGLCKKTCSVCNNTIEEVLPMTGHDFVDGVCGHGCGIHEPSEGLVYKLNAAGTALTVSKGTCSASEVYIADVSEYPAGSGKVYKVTTLAGESFKDHTSMTFLEIPATVENINNNSFSGCSDNLKLSIRGEYDRFTNMASWGATYTPDRLWPDYAATLPKVSETANADFVVGQSYVDEDGYILTVFYKTAGACYAYDPMAVYDLKWGALSKDNGVDGDYVNDSLSNKFNIKDLIIKDSNIGKGIENANSALNETNINNSFFGEKTVWIKLLSRIESTEEKTWFIPSLSECYYLYECLEANSSKLLDDSYFAFTSSSYTGNMGLYYATTIDYKGSCNLLTQRGISIFDLLLAKKIY